jgi:salicylate hydroxylase
MDSGQVLIVGAGIGGLTAALYLHQLGFVVQVYEQTVRTTGDGAGIQLSPNATRVLHQVGLASSLASISSEPSVIDIQHWRTGRRISTMQLASGVEPDQSSFPYYHVQRRDLLACLTRAVVNASIPIHRGKRIDNVGVTETHAWISGPDTHENASLVVGADGIHSSVRRSLFDPDEPIFSGHVAWRGIISSESITSKTLATRAVLWWGPKKHVVHYPVHDGQDINVVCVDQAPHWTNESWTEHGDQKELAAAFGDWHDDIAQLIGRINPHVCFRWGLFNHAPLKQWSRGRVTLLGDACHPTLPYLAQGAAMAIEDGAALAQCLKKCGSVEKGLEAYERVRRKRTIRIQRISRRNGYIFHLTGTSAWARNWAAQHMGERILRYVHDYDVFASINRYFKD